MTRAWITSLSREPNELPGLSRRSAATRRTAGIKPAARPGSLSAVLVLLLMLTAPHLVIGQQQGRVNLADIGLDQRLNEQLPLDLEFYDETGAVVPLRQYFHGKPVILVFAYYRCPMLCTEVLNGLRDSMLGQSFQLKLGDDFDVVTVSFDPSERPDRAAAKKLNYVESMESQGQPDAARGWHFLTGTHAAIEELTRAAGFRYRYDRATDQYAHASGLLVLTPRGKIARYFYGIDYPSRFLRLALVQASEDRIGSPVDQVLLLCYHWDPATGQYTLAVMNLVRGAGALTLLALGTFLVVMLRQERKRKVAGMQA